MKGSLPTLTLVELSYIMHRGICFPALSCSQVSASHYTEKRPTLLSKKCNYVHRWADADPLKMFGVGLWQSGPVWFHLALNPYQQKETTGLYWLIFRQWSGLKACSAVWVLACVCCVCVGCNSEEWVEGRGENNMGREKNRNSISLYRIYFTAS